MEASNKISKDKSTSLGSYFKMYLQRRERKLKAYLLEAYALTFASDDLIIKTDCYKQHTQTPKDKLVRTCTLAHMHTFITTYTAYKLV